MIQSERRLLLSPRSAGDAENELCRLITDFLEWEEAKIVLQVQAAVDHGTGAGRPQLLFKEALLPSSTKKLEDQLVHEDRDSLTDSFRNHVVKRVQGMSYISPI
jgi:hypothetical protein